MSVPSYQFRCTDCAFTGADLRGARYYVYQASDGTELVAPTFLGWCYDCREIQTIQKGLSPQGLHREIRSIEEERSRKSKERRGLFGQRENPDVAFLSEEIGEKRKLLDALGQRCAAPRCVNCGFSNVVEIEIPDDYGLREEVLPFVHPGCGGHLVVFEGARFMFNAEKIVLDFKYAIRLPRELQSQGDRNSNNDRIAGQPIQHRRPEVDDIALDSLIDGLKDSYKQVFSLVCSVEGRFPNAWEAGIFVSSVATTRILSLQKPDPPAIADKLNAKWAQHLMTNPITIGTPPSKKEIALRMQEKFPVYRKLFLNAIDPARTDKASDDAVQLMWELFTNCTGKRKPDDDANFVKLVLASGDLVSVGRDILADIRE